MNQTGLRISAQSRSQLKLCSLVAIFGIWPPSRFRVEHTLRERLSAFYAPKVPFLYKSEFWEVRFAPIADAQNSTGLSFPTVPQTLGRLRKCNRAEISDRVATRGKTHNAV